MCKQLEKKRHLGNDVCLIVFRDADCTEPFSPEIISSQFNHVFIVVQPQPCPAEVPEGYRTTYQYVDSVFSAASCVVTHCVSFEAHSLFINLTLSATVVFPFAESWASVDLAPPCL